MDVKVLRNFTNLQTKFMYLVRLKDIALSAQKSDIVANESLFGQDLVILTKSTTIPEIGRETVKYRFLNRSISIPAGYTFEHSWSFRITMPQNSEVYNAIAKWYYEIEKVGNEYKLNDKSTSKNFLTDAIVQLMTLDGSKVTYIYYLVNVFPVKVPSIDELNYDDTSGHIELELSFSVDYVFHGRVVSYGDDGKPNEIKWVEDGYANIPYDFNFNMNDIISGTEIFKLTNR
jgi:hypothetical protein